MTAETLIVSQRRSRGALSGEPEVPIPTLPPSPEELREDVGIMIQSRYMGSQFGLPLKILLAQFSKVISQTGGGPNRDPRFNIYNMYSPRGTSMSARDAC